MLSTNPRREGKGGYSGEKKRNLVQLPNLRVASGQLPVTGLYGVKSQEPLEESRSKPGPLSYTILAKRMKGPCLRGREENLTEAELLSRSRPRPRLGGKAHWDAGISPIFKPPGTAHRLRSLRYDKSATARSFSKPRTREGKKVL